MFWFYIHFTKCTYDVEGVAINLIVAIFFEEQLFKS